MPLMQGRVTMRSAWTRRPPALPSRWTSRPVRRPRRAGRAQSTRGCRSLAVRPTCRCSADDRRGAAGDDRAVRRPRGARRPSPGLPGDVPRALGARSDRAARGLMARGVADRRPRRHLVAEPLRVGRRSSTPRPASARSSSTSTRRTRRPSWSTRSTSRASACCCLARGVPARPTTRRCSPRSAPRCPRLRDDARARRPTGMRCSLRGARVRGRRAGRARGDRCSSTTRSTSSTRRARPASRRARRSRTTTSSTTATSSASGCGYTERDRVCIPVPFYHCFGMVLGNLGVHHPRRVHGRPGRGVRRRSRCWRRSQAERCTVALRRADDVHRRARAPALRRVRPVVAAHRHHGRLAVPGRGDEAGAVADAHARR